MFLVIRHFFVNSHVIGQLLGTGHPSVHQFQIGPLVSVNYIIADPFPPKKTVMKIRSISRGLHIGLVKRDQLCSNW